MRLGNTLTFVGPGPQAFNVGDLVVNKKKKITHLDLKCTINGLKNNTGGSAALTLAQFLTWLAGTKLTLGYGTRGRQPYRSLDLATLYQISRDRLGAIWPNSQSTGATGPLQTLASGASANPVFYIQIPLGHRWKDSSVQDMGGCGPYQVSTMYLQLNRGADNLPANWSITGNVTFQAVYPEVDSPASEAWEFIPEYTELQTAQSNADMGSGGLPLLLWEKSAAGAASVLSNITGLSDGAEFPIHDQVGAADILNEYLADPELPTGAQWTDTYTPLHVFNTRQREREYVPGKLHFRQNGAMQLTPWVVGLLESPLVTEEEVSAETTAAAKALKREVRAVYASSVVDGVDKGAEWLKPFLGLYFETATEADSALHSGLRATEHSDAAPFVPAGAAQAILARTSVHAAAGNPVAHAHELVKAAANIPGGLSNPAEHKRSGAPGSSQVFARVAQTFKKAG